MGTPATKYAWVSGYDGRYVLNVSKEPVIKDFHHLDGTPMTNFVAAHHLASAIRDFAKQVKGK